MILIGRNSLCYYFMYCKFFHECQTKNNTLTSFPMTIDSRFVRNSYWKRTGGNVEGTLTDLTGSASLASYTYKQSTRPHGGECIQMYSGFQIRFKIWRNKIGSGFSVNTTSNILLMVGSRSRFFICKKKKISNIAVRLTFSFRFK